MQNMMVGNIQRRDMYNVRKGIIHRMSNEGCLFNLNSFFIQLKLIMGKERKDSV